MKKIKVEEVDMISELPNSILHHIISLLPFKQIAQTRVLSERWEEIWHSYPVLEFDRSVFGEDLGTGTIETSKEYKVRAKEILSGLVRILRKRKGKEMMNLDRFTLDMIFFNDYELKSLLDRCISYVIGCNVKELKLMFNIPICAWTWYNPNQVIINSPEKGYNSRQVIFSAKSIEILELEGCNLELPRGKVKLPSLKKSSLTRVYTDDCLMKKLVVGCPLLETLSFSSCFGFTSVKASVCPFLQTLSFSRCFELKSVDACGLSRLNEIELTNNPQLDQVAIKESNIDTFSIVGPAIPHDIDLNIFQDLKSLNLSDFHTMYGWLYSAVFDNLRSLSLSNLSIKEEWLSDRISKLAFLEYLRIDNCYHHEFKKLEISSWSLKTLIILGCPQPVELKLDTPNLHTLECNGILVSYSLALSNFCVRLRCPRGETQYMHVKYVEYLAKLKNRCVESHANLHDFSEVLNLQIENMIIPRELRHVLPSPLSEVKHLNLRLDTLPMRWTITKLVDGLLWIAPHSRNVSITYGVLDESTFKFSFSYKKDGEAADCCKSFPVSCWKDCIEEVKLVISDDYHEGQINRRRFILKGLDIMKQIDALCGVPAS